MSTASPNTVRGLGAPRRGRLEPGEVLDGKYRILRLIAQGGTGAVYEGEHRLIARKVAIKVLHAHIAEDEVAVRRFEREARATAQIGSENIVDVLDLGELPGGDRYLVMEYLEGESLRELMQRPVKPVELVQLTLQLLSALSSAHRVGIVHRDVKPENVFISRRRPVDPPVVKVLDFGVSKNQERRIDSEMTSVGAIVGTPFYMAPEQALGNGVDPRADVYSVGVILFQALSGQLPYQVDSFTQLVVKLSLEEPPKLRDVAPHVDPMLTDIVDRAMARKPEERIPSADALSDALTSWLARQSGRSDYGAALAPADRASAPFGGPAGAGGPRLPHGGAGQVRSTLRGVGAGPPGYQSPGAPPVGPAYPGAMPGSEPYGSRPQAPGAVGGGLPGAAAPGLSAGADPNAVVPTMQLPMQAPPPGFGGQPRPAMGTGLEFAADPTIVAFTRQRQRRLRGALAVVWALVALGAAGAVALLVMPASDSSAAATAEPSAAPDETPPVTTEAASSATTDPTGSPEPTDAAAPATDTTSTATADSASPKPTATAVAAAPKPKTPTSSGGSKSSGGKGKAPKGGSTGGKGDVGGRTIQTEL